MDKWETFHGLLPKIKEDLRQIEAVYGNVEVEELFNQPEEGQQMVWQEEQDEVISFGPIVAQKDVRLEIAVAEQAQWTVKDSVPGHEGEVYPAMKLTLTIADPSTVRTEQENVRPRLTLEHQMNLARYPYVDKKSGEVKWLGRQGLYDLEEAFGFDPVFTNGSGQTVDAFVTRMGRKVAPKGEGIKRSLNPAFTQAYFTADGSPNLEWSGKTVYADIDVEKSDQFGDRNRIVRFKRAPVSV